MYEYKCEVKRVVDGDTVDVIIDLGFDIAYSSRVRLYCIDTTETRTRDKKENIGRMLLMHANNREEIKEAYSTKV